MQPTGRRKSLSHGTGETRSLFFASLGEETEKEPRGGELNNPLSRSPFGGRAASGATDYDRTKLQPYSVQKGAQRARKGSCIERPADEAACKRNEIRRSATSRRFELIFGPAHRAKLKRSANASKAGILLRSPRRLKGGPTPYGELHPATRKKRRFFALRSDFPQLDMRGQQNLNLLLRSRAT